MSYNVPLNKFPATDWISLNAKYLFDYHWQTGPLAVIAQTNQLGINPAIGNTIQNSNTKQLNSTFTMTTLYNKVPFKKLLGPKPPKPIAKPKIDTKPTLADTIGGKKPPPVKKKETYGDATRAIAKIVFSLKNVS